MTDIKPIQTRYKGYHFRSRLEARWAVFFDALGLQWEYEPDGFDIPFVGRYLPDFRLTVPDIGDVFVEVKPTGTTEDGWSKAKKLSHYLDRDVLLLAGVPSPISHTLCFGSKTKAKIESSRVWIFCDNEAVIDFQRHGFSFVKFDDDYLVNRTKSTAFLEAITAARSARFEHGQSGATL